MVKTRQGDLRLLARREGSLRAEHHGEDAVVPGRVGARRTCARGLGERDQLPFERGLDARVGRLDREPEARHGEPVVDHAYHPEVEAWIAGNTAGNGDVLRDATAASTEQAAVDDRVV